MLTFFCILYVLKNRLINCVFFWVQVQHLSKESQVKSAMVENCLKENDKLRSENSALKTTQVNVSHRLKLLVTQVEHIAAAYLYFPRVKRDRDSVLNCGHFYDEMVAYIFLFNLREVSVNRKVQVN